jgi:hypothetical protein
MSSLATFAWTSREDVGHQLAAHLTATPPARDRPAAGPCRDNVARLLARCMCPCEGWHPEQAASVLRETQVAKLEAFAKGA